MRRPPFTVRPLALSVTLVLSSPVVVAADAISTTTSTTITTPVTLTSTQNSITTDNINNITQVTGVVSDGGQAVKLIKKGTGTLSLANNNTYAGGTDIQAGTLSVARAASLGDGKEVILGTGATLDTQASTTLTQDITLTGDATISTTGAENITQVTSTIKDNKNTSGVSAGLTKAGEGTLSLTADNAYHGNTTINQGTLAISRNDSLGTGTLVTINNGATLKTNQDVNIGQDVTIVGQGKIDTGGKNSILSGMVTGGTLEKTGNGSLTLNDESNSQSNTILNGGILIIDDKDKNNVSTLGTGNLEIKKGTLQTSSDMELNNKIITTSSAGGSINTNGHEVTLNGQVTGVGRLVKTGGGTLTLNTANNYNLGIVTDATNVKTAIVGNTVINGGVLAISNDDQLGIAAQTGKLDGDKDLYKWQQGNVLVDGGTLETTQSLTSNRHIYVGAAGATVSVDGAANTTTLTGAIKNDGAVGGSLVKEGAGTLKIDLAFDNYLKSDGSFGITANDSISSITVKEGVLEVENTAKDFGGAAAVTLAGGEIRVNQGASTGNDLGVVTLQGTGGTLDTTGATIRTGKITGNGSLQKQGSGTLVLTGLANDYKGDTTISGGKVQINSAQGLGDANTGKLILDGGSLQVLEDKTAPNQKIVLGKETVISSNNGTIDNVSNDVTLSGAVSGKGQLIKSGAGKFVLSYDKNTFEGGVRIKEGILEVSTDGSLGKENTQVLIDGATLGITKDAELKRQIVLTSKGGTVSVEGSSTATLSGQLALDTDVLSADFTKAGTGTLNLTKDNDGFKGNTIIKEGTLGITGKNNLANGKLFLEGGNLRTNASLNFDKEIIINTTGGVDTALDALGNKTEVTVTGKIQGNGGFVKTGEGTLTLSADNAYAGGTTVQGGTLVVDKDTNLGLASTDVTLDGGTLKLNAASSVDFTTKDNDQDTDDADARKLLIGSGGGTLDITALDVTIETALTGKGTLTQKGNQDSTLTLTANNTALEGGITVENGTLKIKDNTNLGALAATLTLKDGTTLDTTNADTSLVLDRSLTLGDGKVSLKQDENLTIERGLIGSDKSNLVIDTNDKKLVLNGNNSTFAGNLLVEGNIEVKQNLGTGTVEFNQGQDSTTAVSSSVHMTGNATFNNKEFKLNGQTTLVADKDTKSIFNAAINDAEYIEKDAANNDVTKYRKGSLVKTGEGEIVLNTKNAYSGDTSIQQGTVTVAHNEALGTGKVSLANGTTLQSAANVTLANLVEVVSGNVNFSTPQVNQQNTSLTLTNTVSGDASMTKTGVGTLVLNGVNTYTGQTIVKEGTLEINSAAALGTNTELSLSAGTTLITTGQMTQKDDTTDKTLSKNILLVGQAGSQVTINTVGGDVILSGKLQNDAVNNQAGIIKEGVSTLTLSGDNSSYQGKTTIKDGNIAISDKKNLGGKVDVELVGVKLPSGELVGGGLTLLENLTILAQNEDGSTNSINIIGTGKGEINTASGTTSELGVAFKGTGKFVKQGDGELILSGDNTDFAGGVSVDKGILTITKDVSLGKTNTDVILNGGTLQANGVTTLDRNVQLTKDSTIKNISATETVTLNRLTNAHQITLEGGSFNLANDGTHTNQHDGTVLKNTTVTILSDADLGQSTNTSHLTFTGATLNVQEQPLDLVREVVINKKVVVNKDDNRVNILNTNKHSVTLSKEISGDGGIVKDGGGQLTLNQDNSYSGGTQVLKGKVAVDADKALGTGTATFAGGTELSLGVTKGVSVGNDIQLGGAVQIHNNVDFASSLTGKISDDTVHNKIGSLVKDGIGQLTLSQDNSYSGGTQVQQGKVVINTNKALGTGVVNLQAGSALETSQNLNLSNQFSLTGSDTAVEINTINTANLTLSQTLSGNANLAKNGTGTLTLKGVNSEYQGNITINQGKIIAANNDALGKGDITLETAKSSDIVLELTSDVSQLSNDFVINGDNNVNTKTDLFELNIGQGQATTLSGVISGDAGFVKTGAGTLTLANANTYQGDTNIDKGKLVLANSSALGKATNSLILQDETELEFANTTPFLENNIQVKGTTTINALNDTVLNGVVSDSGSIIKTGVGTLTLNRNNTYTGQTLINEGKVAIKENQSLGVNNSVVFKADNTTLQMLSTAINVANDLVLEKNANLEIDGNTTLVGGITGSGMLTKKGVGGLILNHNNQDYAGDIVVENGKLAVATSQALGKTGNKLELKNGSTLETTESLTLDKQLVVTGANTLANIVVASGETTTMVNSISGDAGIRKQDTGTLVLMKENTYQGETVVETGTIAIDHDKALSTKKVTFANGTELSLGVTKGVNVANNIQLDGQVKVHSSTFNSTLTSVSGAGGFIKDGEGQLTLSQDNSYKGGTTIQAGKVAIQTNQAFGSGDVTFGSGDIAFGQNTQLVINANVSLANNLNLAGATTLADQGFNTTLKGNINGAGALTKSDTGLLTVESSNSTYNSAVNINKGSVAINKSDALGTGTLTLAQDTGITTIVGQDITLNNNSIVLQGDGDPDTTTDKVSFNIANNQVLTLSNELKGDASLVKDGNGTLTLSGIKTNTGNLVVNAGTVSIANASAVGSGAMIFAEKTRLQSAVNTILANQIVFNGNTTFDTASNSSLSVQANAITGEGGLTKTGEGKLAVNVNNLYLGNTVIERGSVLVAANQAFSTGKVSFKSGTSLELQSNIANALDLTGNVTVSATTNFGLTGAITGTGNFIKQGEGTVALASDNSAYQGSATIEAGRLALQTAFGTDNTITLKANTGLDIIANNFVLTNNLKLDGNATLSVFNNNVTLLGKLSGTSTLTKDGVGVLNLAADNSSYNSDVLVNAGLVAVSNDANLGSLSNSIRLDNGGIRSLTNQNYFHNLSLAVAGGNIDTGANQVTWSGVVSGDGNLTKIGEGTLTLAGVNTYKGTTVINAGTLSVANVNSLGNTTNLAISNATFNPTANLAIGNVSISNTANILTDNTLSVNGVVSGSGALIKKGTGNLELLSANTYAGGTILEGGTLTLGTGNSLGTGALTLRSGQLSLKEGFTSTKTLTQNAADKTTEMLGSGAFANTVVDQGLLLVNGTLTSPITVGSKGTLGGSGKVIGDNISVAGVLSPGNSPAVLSVQGNVTQDVGSTLKIDIDGLTAGTGAGHYDQLNVSGNYVIKSGTTLDAKLRGITGLANNNFVPVIGQSFDIVKANNVNGVFAQYQQLEGVKDGLAADTILRVGYTTNSVVLYVTPKSYSAIVSGENRQGAGVFLDNILKAVDKDPTLLAGNTDVAKFYRALVPASSQALNDALLMMSPAVYAESAQNILSLQQTLHNTQTIADTFTKGGVALKALAKEVDIDSDGNGVSATHSIAGVQLSVDSEPYKNGWQIGANLSVVNKANVEANNAKITTSGQDVTLSLRKKMGDWLLTGSIDVGSYDFDARRNIVIANDVFNTSQESMKSMTRGLGLTAGTQMGNFLLSGGVRYNSVVQDGFVEAGNSLLKLDVEKVEENQVIAMAGGTWAKTWKGSMWSIAPKVGLQLEQTVVGDTAQVKASLASQQVSATASEVGKTLVRAMIGVNFVNVDGINIGIDASTEQADNLSANTGRLTFSKSF